MEVLDGSLSLYGIARCRFDRFLGHIVSFSMVSALKHDRSFAFYNPQSHSLTFTPVRRPSKTHTRKTTIPSCARKTSPQISLVFRFNGGSISAEIIGWPRAKIMKKTPSLDGRDFCQEIRMKVYIYEVSIGVTRFSSNNSVMYMYINYELRGPSPKKTRG